MFFTAMTFFSYSMNNEECKIRPAITNINSNELLFNLYSVLVNKFSASCNDINNLYANLCVPDVVENMNIKVINQKSRINGTRHVSWYDTCTCKCRLDPSVWNNKQCWNNDKCRWEWKELIDKGRCDNGFIWNPSICECECDKLYNIGNIEIVNIEKN